MTWVGPNRRGLGRVSHLTGCVARTDVLVR